MVLHKVSPEIMSGKNHDHGTEKRMVRNWSVRDGSRSEERGSTGGKKDSKRPTRVWIYSNRNRTNENTVDL